MKINCIFSNEIYQIKKNNNIISHQKPFYSEKKDFLVPKSHFNIINFIGKQKTKSILEMQIKSYFQENGITNIANIEAKLKLWLNLTVDKDRYKHSVSAQKTAQRIAHLLGYNEERAGLAALIHDNAKKFTDEELLKIATQKKLEIFDQEEKKLSRLHAPVGAYLAETKLGITDSEILKAIRFHTIGSEEMTLLEKITFLADKIEPFFRSDKIHHKVFDILNKTKDIDKALEFLNK